MMNLPRASWQKLATVIRWKPQRLYCQNIAWTMGKRWTLTAIVLTAILVFLVEKETVRQMKLISVYKPLV
jgi:hypothetical protein